VPSSDPRYTVGQLVTLDGLGIELPPAVTKAIRAFHAAEQLRVPAPPRPGLLVQQAMAAEADRLAREAASSPSPALDLSDLSAIGTARVAEQEAADRQALAQQLRDAAALVLAEAVAQSRGELVASLQQKHQAIVTDLCKRARRLPPGADETSALETGGQHRADWLACRDHVAGLAQLRTALRLVDSHPPPELNDGIAFATAWERSGKLAAAWLAPAGTTVYGPLGSLPFWLGAGREPGFEWWLPTSGEQRERIGALRAARQAQRLQAAAR
jgi:hypothetical protein